MKMKNKYNLPSSICKALQSDHYDYQPDKISVTTLIDSPHIAKLKREHWDEIEEDVSERIWALLGSAVHYIIENAGDENTLQEHRMSAEVAGKTITGQCDLYNAKTKTLQDIKVTSVWTVIYGSRMDDYTAQLNCYAWLLRKHGMPVEKVQIVAILRDWVESKSRDEGYPDVQIKVIDLPLWTESQQEEYIKERLLKHEKAEPCTKEERWASEDKYAVMKEGRKSAVKLFDEEVAAQGMAETDKKLYVQKRPGQDRRCIRYCSVCNFCEYFQKTYDEQKHEENI